MRSPEEKFHHLLIITKIFLAVFFLFMGYRGAISIRTMTPDFHTELALFPAIVFSGLPSIFLLWRLKWGMYLAGILAFTFIPFIAAETQATYEEQWFLNRCRNKPDNTGLVVHDRWWPSKGELLYDPDEDDFFLPSMD